MEKLHFDVQGMSCASCQAHVTKAVQKLDGTENVNVNLLTNDMYVDVDKNKVSVQDIEKAVKDAGYGASLSEDSKENMQHSDNSINSNKKNKSYAMKNRVQESNDKIIKHMKNRLVISLVFWIPLMIIAMHHMLHIPMKIFDGIENSLIFAFTQVLFVIPIIFVNRELFKSGFKSLSKGKPNMDALVAIGATASIIYGIIAIYEMSYGFGHGDFEMINNYRENLYFESAGTILTLITVGKYLEAKSKGKTGDAISKLIDLAPKNSVVIRDGKEVTIPTEEIVEGDIIVIKPGTSIPVDGVVTEGNSSIDESSITGESIPVEKEKGDKVTSGTVNKNGTFKMKALKVGDETTLSKIVKLVEDASISKAPIENIADNVAGVFVPIVIVIAIITFIVWFVMTKNIELALNFAISVLVISCPCALGLATPVAIMVGTGKGAENGILIKDAESLQALSDVKVVIFDKTGTITKGKPKVTDILSNIDEKEFIKIAGTLENSSEHPLAEAIVEKANEYKVSLDKVENFERISGRGIKAIFENETYLAGNIKLMNENNVDFSEYESKAEKLLSEGKTVLYFAKDGKTLGIIAVRDKIKEDSKSAISALHKLGIKTIMITGDNRVVAKNIAKEVGIDKVYAEIIPEEKEKIVEKIQNELNENKSNENTKSRKVKVAFVGDGINDSPALTKADVGLAIGSGTDIAIESADIILVRNSLMDVVSAIELSNKTMKNIKENLFWAFFYNVICIPVAAGVYYNSLGLKLNPMIGSAAMAFSSLFVCANALRLRFFKPRFATYEYNEVIRKNKESQKEIDNIQDNNIVKEKKIMKKELKIEGMMCENCVKHVTKALEGIDGIEKADVSLENKNAVIEETRDVSDKEIKDAVADAGYKVTEIK